MRKSRGPIVDDCAATTAIRRGLDWCRNLVVRPAVPNRNSRYDIRANFAKMAGIFNAGTQTDITKSRRVFRARRLVNLLALVTKSDTRRAL